MLQRLTKTLPRPILLACVRQRWAITTTVVRILIALTLLLCFRPAQLAIAAAGNLIVESNSPITPPPGAHLNWYEMKADPEDSHNLIVCGAKRDAQANAYVGVVYYSHDGGRTWRTAVEDRNSTWVSEQSCAFGSRHHAYFISEASKVIDGIPYHHLGTTRIFVSLDAGETWAETAQTAWADYSSSVVTRSPTGADELYVFFNSGSEYDAAKRFGNTLGYFVTSEDGKVVERHETIPGMAKLNYQGAFPSSSVTLNDGTIVVLYNAGIPTERKGQIPIEIGVVRFTESGPSPPVVLADPTFTYARPLCPSSISTSLAYDRGRDLLYMVFNSIRAGHCSLMISTSNDGGRNWSTAHELTGGPQSQLSKYFPILAINENGVLGIQWRGRADLSPGCWYFSTSRDGLKIDASVLLSPCLTEESIEQQSSEYLATLINQPEAGRPATVQILTLRDYLTRVAITATPDGKFHPAWVTSRNGNSELRTGTIRIRSSRSRSKPLCSTKLSDITDKITVLYDGEQRIDHFTRIVAVNLAFQNHSAVSLHGPLYLKIENTGSDFGQIKVTSGPGRPVPNTDYFEILRPGTAIAPGERTPTYSLSFRFTSICHHPPKQYVVAKATIKVFCRQNCVFGSAGETDSSIKSSSPPL